MFSFSFKKKKHPEIKRFRKRGPCAVSEINKQSRVVGLWANPIYSFRKAFSNYLIKKA